jgi:two-component system NtrC family sensor kinase
LEERIVEDNSGNRGSDVFKEEIRIKEAIIDGISDALMLLDAKTFEILEVNRAFLASYGLTREQVVGKKCYEVTHHLSSPCSQAEIHSLCPLEESVSSGNMSLTEHIHQDSDGQDLYSEITTYPLKDATGQVAHIIHLSRDVTERKYLEFQLREKEKLNGILEIAGGASHEINQPLTVIISGLKQLVKRLEPTDPEHELAQMVLDHANRLREVSEKLAQITRYATTEYVAGKNIVDLDQASEPEPDS